MLVIDEFDAVTQGGGHSVCGHGSCSVHVKQRLEGHRESLR